MTSVFWLHEFRLKMEVKKHHNQVKSGFCCRKKMYLFTLCILLHFNNLKLTGVSIAHMPTHIPTQKRGCLTEEMVLAVKVLLD